MKAISKMTVEEILNVPLARWDEIIICDTLVIVPGSGEKKKLHDSGYRTMRFVAIVDGKPYKVIDGGTDSFALDGPGGYGDFQARKGLPAWISPRGWSMDCLPASGLIQLFCPRHKIKTGYALSTFSVYAVEDKS